MKTKQKRGFFGTISCLTAAILWLLATESPFLRPMTAEAVSGRTYYISESAGNDDNDGLSEKSPWKTIARLAQTTLTSGDTVLFKRGDVWYGSSTLDLSGGSKNNPIKISAYGNGQNPGFRYYLGAVSDGGSGIVLTLKNPNGVVFSDLNIGYANQGIDMTYDPAHFGSEYVRFENVHFHDIYGVHQLDNNAEIYFSSGISVGPADYQKGEQDTREYWNTHKWPLTGLYLHRCTAYDAGSLVRGPMGVKGFYMTECVAENNGYYGTTAFGMDGGYIDRCVFDGNGTRPMPPGSCGIMVSGSNFMIKNTVIKNQRRQGNDPDGCGIDFEHKNNNVAVENCMFQGNAGVGVFFFTSGQLENGTNYDCKVNNCIFADNNTNVGNVGGFEIFASDYAAGRCEVSGNRWFAESDSGSVTTEFALTGKNNDLKQENNLRIDTLPGKFEPPGAWYPAKNGESK